MEAETLSTIISWIVAIFFIAVQLGFFIWNNRSLVVVKKFFQKNNDYGVLGKGEGARLDTSIAIENSEFRTLIEELNEYIRKNHGTSDFSIIQNKTDRKIEALYDGATSRIAFPIYIGLMGTFLGVFLGLLFFNSGLKASTEGVTDEAIRSLIRGVLISMSTSFIGLLLTTISNYYAGSVRSVVDKEKNNFFDFIQTQLMPTLGVSMVAALNKLHHTINLFEPSFNRVIEQFQATFESCTQRFGDSFGRNVEIVSTAVNVMGENMNKINENVDLQVQLLRTLRSRGVVESLDAFVGAAQSFETVIFAINQLESINQRIAIASQDLINTQQRYNSSLEIPLNIVDKLNLILDRIIDFENSINALGRSIEKTDMWGNTELEALQDSINVIKKKQAIAVEAMQLSDGHLENIFEMQGESIQKLGRKYEDALSGFAERYETELENITREMKQRRREIVAVLEEKFSLDQIKEEFSQLGKLQRIETLLTSIDSHTSREERDRILFETKREVEAIKFTLDQLLHETRKKRSTPIKLKKEPKRKFLWIFPVRKKKYGETEQ